MRRSRHCALLASLLHKLTVKSQIESATLFKIWLFWRDSNRVRIVFEWGLYFFIYFKWSKNRTKLAVNSSKMMKNIANLKWFIYIDIELTIYYIAKSCQISFFGHTKDLIKTQFKWGHYLSEDSIKISNLSMRILFEWGLYSNADSILDFTVFSKKVIMGCPLHFFTS